MIFVRLSAVRRFISSCSRCWGKNSGVVMNTGPGQARVGMWAALCCSGRPQYPLGRAMVAREWWCLAHSASARGLSSATATSLLWMSTLRARAQCSRTVVSTERLASKSAFLAAMSHEIRPPMNAVGRFLGGLAHDDSHLEQLRKIMEQARTRRAAA